MRGLVDKTDAGYNKFQTDLVRMRRLGDLPYSWLADDTRWQRKPQTYDSIQDALDQTAKFYRRSLCAEANCYVEIWLGKDALPASFYRSRPNTTCRSWSPAAMRALASCIVQPSTSTSSMSRPTSTTSAMSIRAA